MARTPISDITKAALAVDKYCLGAHWIYDAEELESLPIDWEGLNAPQAAWHAGKKAGDFTHYGDQLAFLDSYVSAHDAFDINDYQQAWAKFMDSYNGYRDGSSKTTLKAVKSGGTFPCGSTSKDLSIIGRISPLLKYADSEDGFLAVVEELIKMSHNSEMVRVYGAMVARILWHVQSGISAKEAIVIAAEKGGHITKELLIMVEAKLGDPIIETLRGFGTACGANQGMPGALYLLLIADDRIKEMFIANAKAGGDSSARAMVVAMILVAESGIGIIPERWL